MSTDTEIFSVNHRETRNSRPWTRSEDELQVSEHQPVPKGMESVFQLEGLLSRGASQWQKWSREAKLRKTSLDDGRTRNTTDLMHVQYLNSGLRSC